MVIFGNSGKNARLIGTALLIMTFVAGALAGAAVFRVVNARPHGETRMEGRPPMRGGTRRLLLDDQFSKELGLTDTQRTQIKAILDRRDAEAKQMWSEVEPKLKSFGKQVHDEIEKVLTPEQQKKLDAALATRRKGARHHKCAPGDSLNQKREKE
ncbi:MAG TPA: hypothetical protein VM100_08220 [Longimicrobiales bacterium]|nr:hypothetical protein [Longimicrobiales bacterium]